MSVTLTSLKAFLSVTHDEDDAKLTLLLAAADDEATRFLEVSQLPDVASVDLGVMMLVRAGYDAETADEAQRWREIARSTMHSYRKGLGA